MVPMTWSASSGTPSSSASSRKLMRSSRRVGEVVVDLRPEVVEEVDEAADALARRQVDTPSRTWVHEGAEQLGVLLGQAEHVGDDAHRDVLGVVGRGVDHGPARQVVDQALGSTPRVDGSSASMACGAKAGSSRRRAPWWNGGSDEIGGATPRGAGAIGRPSFTMTFREVKCSVSYAMATHVVVAGRQPDAAVAVGVGHRAGARAARPRSGTGRRPRRRRCGRSRWPSRRPLRARPSGLLDDVDGVLGAVGDRQAGLVLERRVDGAVPRSWLLPRSSGSNTPAAMA